MPKIVDHEQYRAELLDRAFDLFARHGFAAVTMRKLATELGVSTGTLYHYFAGKEELFEQTAERVAQTNLSSLVQALAQVHDLNARFDLLEAFVESNWALLSNGLALLMEFQRITGGTAAQRTMVTYREAIRSGFSDLPDANADLLFTALVGLTIESGADPDAGAPALRMAGFRRLLVVPIVG